MVNLNERSKIKSNVFTNSILIAGFILILISFIINMPFNIPSRSIESYLRNIEKQEDMKIGIWAYDIKNDKHYTYNIDITFPLASTAKLIILEECFRSVENGELDLESDAGDVSKFLVGGSGLIRALPNRIIKFSIHNGLYFMMRFSDNSVTNMIMAHLDLDKVNSRIKDVLGKQMIIINRPYGLDAPGEMPQALMPMDGRDVMAEGTPEGLGTFLLKLYNKELLSQENTNSCLRLIEVNKLKNNSLPNTDIIHKTGTLSWSFADAGIIDPSGDPIIFTFMFVQNEGFIKLDKAKSTVDYLVKRLYENQH